MESCWGSLKTELGHHCRFATREQAKREITAYIEIFYNRIRKQARLGHLSPAAFSQQYHAMQMADQSAGLYDLQTTSAFQHRIEMESDKVEIAGKSG